jgi:hypothetical protein
MDPEQEWVLNEDGEYELVDKPNSAPGEEKS